MGMSNGQQQLVREKPGDFVDLAEVVAGLQLDSRYATSNNFTGQIVPGYHSPRLWLTRTAAEALAAVQETLARSGLACKIFDAYRPQRAVDFFIQWTQAPDRAELKAYYYPDIDKNVLFQLGYLVANSSHSRGSTVDLTLIDSSSGAELDMGTHFDFFAESSRPDSLLVNAQQRANRLLLSTVMGSHGFKPLAEEWWHFTLKHEPYPHTSFDFVID